MFMLLLLTVLTLVSCAPAYRNQPAGPPTPRTTIKPPPEPSNFRYQSLRDKWKASELFWKETGQYRVSRVEIWWKTGSEKENSSLEFDSYQSKLPGEKKTIIVLPIYSRKPLNELLPIFLVSWLTIWNPDADFNLIHIRPGKGHDPFDLDSLEEVDSEQKTIEWMGESARRFRKIVAGLRAVLDWAEKENSIDKNRIGIVGFSTSAPVAIMAASIDQRISATVSYAGVVSFQDVFAEASEPRIKRIRELITSQSASWKYFLQTAVSIFEPVNPLRYVQNLNPAKTLYFEAEFDEYISGYLREKLWNDSGRPERVIFSARHHESFLALTPLGLYSAERKIIDFFREKL